MTMTVTTVSNNKDDNIEMLVISSKKYQKASQNKFSSDLLRLISIHDVRITDILYIYIKKKKLIKAYKKFLKNS